MGSDRTAPSNGTPLPTCDHNEQSARSFCVPLELDSSSMSFRNWWLSE